MKAKSLLCLFLLTLLSVLPSTGCATAAGLGGKAHYVQSFEDTEADTIAEDGTRTPGQSTKYNLDIKGPAGMKWEEITGMGYEWDAQHGKIAINSQSKADTLATAEAIKAVIPAITETLTGAIANAVSEGMRLAAPLVGQSITGKQTNEAAKLQLDAATKAQLIELLKSLGASVSPTTPPTVVTAPPVSGGAPVVSTPEPAPVVEGALRVAPPLAPATP